MLTGSVKPQHASGSSRASGASRIASGISTSQIPWSSLRRDIRLRKNTRACRVWLNTKSVQWCDSQKHNRDRILYVRRRLRLRLVKVVRNKLFSFFLFQNCVEIKKDRDPYPDPLLVFTSFAARWEEGTCRGSLDRTYIGYSGQE